uniref:Uncharacterized protein n=1 Tax=Eutreptiella gymnastica TaxID=73025 RepID=A0A7S4FP19_9EUGL
MMLTRFVSRLATASTPRLVCGHWAAQGQRAYSTGDVGLLEYLLRAEKDCEDYYRGLANKATNSGSQRIFTMLADDKASLHQGAVASARRCQRPLRHPRWVLQVRNSITSKGPELEWVEGDIDTEHNLSL